MEDNTGGGPIVVLMNIGTEGGPVVVDIEQTDFPATGWVNIQSAARFNRKSIGRSGVAADAGDGGVRARTTKQGFDKRRGAPAISPTVEVTWPEMISIKDVLGAAHRYHAVAAVSDDL